MENGGAVRDTAGCLTLGTGAPRVWVTSGVYWGSGGKPGRGRGALMAVGAEGRPGGGRGAVMVVVAGGRGVV